MVGNSSIQVNGCPLCEIFSKDKVLTKLYYPEQEKITKIDDFVIVDCYKCNNPIVVVSDHTTEIGKEQWGRILYRCKLLFGSGVRLNIKRRFMTDHWHAHIVSSSINLNKLPDLRLKD